MYDEDQTWMPPSFRSLHCDRRDRLLITAPELKRRYELCEDLAQSLIEYSRGVHHDLGVAEDEVLRRCRLGLLVEPAQVTPAEATWIVARLAELQNWPWPDAPGGSDQAAGGSARR
ncbi:MAG: hypothetical protein AB7G13_34100 [Lautropia sp.]